MKIWKKNKASTFTWLLLVALATVSCSQVDIMMPKGPKGDTGATGKDGLSAYEVWKNGVDDGTIAWPKDQTTITDFFKFLKGKDGNDGKDGTNGKSAYELWKEVVATGSLDDPHNPGSKWPTNKNSMQDFWEFLTGASGEDGQTPNIGANGNWWIGQTDTNIPARGKKGEKGDKGADATPPVITIGANGNWFIDGVDTNTSARGKDGKTPEIAIGTNGNWFIDGVDTNTPARGKDGKTPEIAIGTNGNWFIDGVDTNKPAYGKKGDKGDDGQDGTNGENGLSAYELWKKEVKEKCGTADAVKDPHSPGIDWPCADTTTYHFWQFLRGADGRDGEFAPIAIVPGKYNVIPQYWNADEREYVSPRDGAVTFKVYDKNGAAAPKGSKVKGLPGVDPNAEFETDKDGMFKVGPDKLPDKKILGERTGSTASVTINGHTEASSNNTIVPNRINFRIVNVYAYFSGSSGAYTPYVYADYTAEREVNGVWKRFPSYLSSPSATALEVIDSLQPVSESNTKPMSQNIRYSGLYFYRPLVLTAEEKEYIKTNPNSDLAKYQWDGTTRPVVTFKVGDKAGYMHDYGTEIYCEDKFQIPEVNPICGLKNVKVDIVKGITTLWGEFDLDQLSYFYNKYEKDPATNIWKPVEKREAREINDVYSSFYLTLSMSSSIQATSGNVYTSTKYPIFKDNNNRFELIGAYPDNTVTLYGSASQYFRGYNAYQLRLTSDGKYYLEDNRTKKKMMDVPQETKPSDWRK